MRAIDTHNKCGADQRETVEQHNRQIQECGMLAPAHDQSKARARREQELTSHILCKRNQLNRQSTTN